MLRKNGGKKDQMDYFLLQILLKIDCRRFLDSKMQKMDCFFGYEIFWSEILQSLH